MKLCVRNRYSIFLLQFAVLLRYINMTNYKKLFALCTLIACLFTGCSNSTSSNTSKDNEITTTEEVKETPIVTMDPEIHVDNLMGIYIGKNQSQIGLGLTTDDTKSILGAPSDKTKKGKKQTWSYTDLDVTIIFTKTGDTYTIQSIKGGKNATTLKTGGGIIAGAGKQDVLDAYGDAVVENKKGNLVADNMGYSQIVFTIDNDVVVGITMELL